MCFDYDGGQCDWSKTSYRKCRKPKPCNACGVTMSEPEPIDFRPRWSDGLSADAMRELEQEPCIGKAIDEEPVSNKGLLGEAEQHIMPNGERLSAYLFAMFHEGPLAGEWKDKPHRLVYDLVKEVLRLKEKAGE